VLEGEKTQDQEDGKDQLEKSIETNSTSNLEINNNDLHRGERTVSKNSLIYITMTQQEDIKRRLKIMENIDNDKLQYLVKSLRKIEGI
jgi:hypothetical protein